MYFQRVIYIILFTDLHDERVRELSKFAFQILYWLTDNALETKELASVSTFANDDKVNFDITRIMKDVHESAEKAKSYYNQFITSKTDDELRAVYEFILPLFNKCYKSHCKRDSLGLGDSNLINR